MVIDKTTGKGCAWSIVSKTVAKRLIAEGIMEKPIYRKPRDELLRVIEYRGWVYVSSQRGSELPPEPLWTPSFIDAVVWAQAVSRFPNFESLDRSVEKYLLPEMGEYLQGIPDTELISITRDFLIEHGVINVPISHRRGNTYYFNTNEVYALDKNSELFPYEGPVKFCAFDVRNETCFNMNVWRKAVSQYKVGMTLDECISIFLQTELAHNVPQEPSPIDRLMQYIAPPIYERVPGNDDEATFDRVRITVGVPRYQFNSWKALQNEAKKYQREIRQRVEQRIEKDRQFKKYDVPITFLKLSNVTLLRDYSIEFIFEPKITALLNMKN